jgi:GNAT superfamily N-acetyltransferase
MYRLLIVDDEYEIRTGLSNYFPWNDLGRSLLRAVLLFAKDKGYKAAILCVNAENERAKALYIQEGFKQVEG